MKRASLLCAACLGLIACGSPTQIKGRILDEGGHPIARAEIQTEPETVPTLSSSKGFFSIMHREDPNSEDPLPLPEGEYTLKVVKDRYEVLTYDFEVKAGLNQLGELKLKERVLRIVDDAPQATKDKHHTALDTSTPVLGP